MNAWRVPYEAHTSVVGYASEGSACLREGRLRAEALRWRRPASAKAGPTKHVEEPRLRAVTHFGVQARASARGGSTLSFIPPFLVVESNRLSS
jgi:hypothetical protein